MQKKIKIKEVIISNFGVNEVKVFSDFSNKEKSKYCAYITISFKHNRYLKSPSQWLKNQQLLSFKIIGQKLGISSQTAYATYVKAMKKLKIIFKNRNISLKDFEIWKNIVCIIKALIL